MSISLLLFLIGTLGFVLNRKNIILMLISIEIMLLAITFLILVSSLSFDDILGQTYAIYIIAIAGAESAIGLGILVAFYRLRERSLPTPTYSLLPLKNNYIKKVSSKLRAVSTKNTRSTVEFRVSILSHLINVIIPHFDKYSLITNKHSDFFIFKQIVLLMSENQHRNLEGLQLILNNRASLN
ncbi:NADH-ubiquinone/plastoquinone oxidoreductase chain 4L-domain-containing protein [Tuber brumale]|nr:NADH-ubiquinone/plastoquinone oxidoreductase chain 4L-domain-containing protein [Tuber brumale]